MLEFALTMNTFLLLALALLTASAPAPKANFTADCSGKYGLRTCQFDAHSSTSTGLIKKYVWKFGDGTTATATEPVIRHTYAKPSLDYPVILVITDDTKATSQKTVHVKVFGDGPAPVTPPVIPAPIHDTITVRVPYPDTVRVPYPVPYPVHDTVKVPAPYAVHDTVTLPAPPPVHDTVKVPAPYPVHDTIPVPSPPVHDTVTVRLPAIHDTVYAMMPAPPPNPQPGTITIVTGLYQETWVFRGTTFLGRLVQNNDGTWSAFRYAPPSIVLDIVGTADTQQAAAALL